MLEGMRHVPPATALWYMRQANSHSLSCSVDCVTMLLAIQTAATAHVPACSCDQTTNSCPSLSLLAINVIAKHKPQGRRSFFVSGTFERHYIASVTYRGLQSRFFAMLIRFGIFQGARIGADNRSVLRFFQRRRIARIPKEMCAAPLTRCA